MKFSKPNGPEGDLETNSGLLNFPTAYDTTARGGVIRCLELVS